MSMWRSIHRLQTARRGRQPNGQLSERERPASRDQTGSQNCSDDAQRKGKAGPELSSQKRRVRWSIEDAYRVQEPRDQTASQTRVNALRRQDGPDLARESRPDGGLRDRSKWPPDHRDAGSQDGTAFPLRLLPFRGSKPEVAYLLNPVFGTLSPAEAHDPCGASRRRPVRDHATARYAKLQILPGRRGRRTHPRPPGLCCFDQCGAAPIPDNVQSGHGAGVSMAALSRSARPAAIWATRDARSAEAARFARDRGRTPTRVHIVSPPARPPPPWPEPGYFGEADGPRPLQRRFNVDSPEPGRMSTWKGAPV